MEQISKSQNQKSRNQKSPNAYSITSGLHPKHQFNFKKKARLLKVLLLYKNNSIIFTLLLF